MTENPVVRMLRTLQLWLLLLMLGALSLGWNAIALLLYPLLPRERGMWLGRAMISRVYRAVWDLGRVTGLMKLDARALDPLRDEPGVIFVSNHPSVLDALLIISRLPRGACLMKASLMANPLLGPGARLARYIRNDTAVATVRSCVKDLRGGGQLVLFPEGTRTVRHPINEFRPGVTLISRLAKAPIQTIFIDTDSPYSGKGWPLWKLPPLPMNMTLRLGRRFEPATDEDALLRELERYIGEGVRTNVVDNLARAKARMP